jgi:hypothetical protein
MLPLLYVLLATARSSLKAQREAKAHAALDSRLSSRRQRTQGSEFRPLGHLRHHRR